MDVCNWILFVYKKYNIKKNEINWKNIQKEESQNDKLYMFSICRSELEQYFYPMNHLLSSLLLCVCMFSHVWCSYFSWLHILHIQLSIAFIFIIISQLKACSLTIPCIICKVHSGQTHLPHGLWERCCLISILTRKWFLA